MEKLGENVKRKRYCITGGISLSVKKINFNLPKSCEIRRILWGVYTENRKKDIFREGNSILIKLIIELIN